MITICVVSLVTPMLKLLFDQLAYCFYQQLFKVYLKLELSMSFCSTNQPLPYIYCSSLKKSKYVYWPFKSDLSSTTKSDLMDYNLCCEFGHTQAAAKLELLFDKLAYCLSQQLVNLYLKLELSLNFCSTNWPLYTTA